MFLYADCLCEEEEKKEEEEDQEEDAKLPSKAWLTPPVTKYYSLSPPATPQPYRYAREEQHSFPETLMLPSIP